MLYLLAQSFVLKLTIVKLFYNNLEFKFLLILILSLFIYYICYDKEPDPDITKHLYDFKINNFLLNNIYVISYVLFNIVLLLYIRTQYLNKEINLYLQALNIKVFLTGNTLLDTLLIISFIIMVLYIIIFWWIKFNHFFLMELRKRYIIFIKNAKHSKHVLDHNSTRWDTIRSLCIDHRRLAVTSFTWSIIKYFYTPSSETIYRFNIKFTNFLIKRFPPFFMIAYFLYELIWNNLILSATFNQTLFIFTFYAIYVRISNFIIHTNFFIDRMLYNMYYKSWSIKYIGIPKEYENIIYQYVYDKLYCTDNDYNMNDLKMALTILSECTWTTIDGETYENSKGEIEIVKHNDKDLL